MFKKEENIWADPNYINAEAPTATQATCPSPTVFAKKTAYFCLEKQLIKEDQKLILQVDLGAFGSLSTRSINHNRNPNSMC